MRRLALGLLVGAAALVLVLAVRLAYPKDEWQTWGFR